MSQGDLIPSLKLFAVQPAVISFNQSTVDFISGRKDPLFLSIGDNCCPSSQHSNIEVVVRQFMATTLDNLNYYIYKAQKFSRFVNGTYSVKIMYNETRCSKVANNITLYRDAYVRPIGDSK